MKRIEDHIMVEDSSSSFGDEKKKKRFARVLKQQTSKVLKLLGLKE